MMTARRRSPAPALAPRLVHEIARNPVTTLPYVYLVANNYMDAIEYRHAKDLCAHTTRYVSCADVLKGTVKPCVIVLGKAELVPESIVEALARHQAEVIYDSL